MVSQFELGDYDGNNFRSISNDFTILEDHEHFLLKKKRIPPLLKWHIFGNDTSVVDVRRIETRDGHEINFRALFQL